MAILKTRPLDPVADWDFFHSRHPISPADREEIRPLEEASACSLWQELVSSDPRERHPMLLPREHWIGRLVAAGPSWQEFWNYPERPDAVAAFLGSKIEWPVDVEVIFIWMRERAARATWGTFLRA